MKFSAFISFAAVLVTSQASPSPAAAPLPADAALSYAALRRSLPNSPTKGYTPGKLDCPGSNRPTIRSASELSPQEKSWLEKRRANTVDPMRDFLGRMDLGGFDAKAYIDRNAKNASALPNIGLAFSGGGYRALLNGAGNLKAFDSRTDGSTGAGQLGGLLQASTYIAGLSGGSWLVGSVYVNNFTTISQLQTETSSSVWEFENSILKGPKKAGLSILNTASYFDDLVTQVSGKGQAGFNTTLTDYWSRALSYQLINATDGGPAYSWSSIAEDSAFSQAQAPMPLVVADGRAPNEYIISSNTTIFEFSPFEFGTFDPNIFGFAPLKYIGSPFDSGKVPNDQKCVAGFDNAGYVMGTSSSLFNQFVLQFGDNVDKVPKILQGVIKDILSKLSVSNEDIADYSPNPFYNYNPATNPSAKTKQLTLVDGGEDLQNIPLHPLIQPARGLDVIIAVDSSADTPTNWPNGTALVATYERSRLDRGIANGTSFPAIPDVNTFVNRGLNNHPVFFGCDSRNTSSPTPLVVYIPHAPYVYHSNVSTLTLSYNNTERNAIVLNGYNVATQANGTLDSQWGTCLACAVLSRSLERTNTPVPDACRQCFDRYCWDGKTEPNPPSKVYEPAYKAGADKIVDVTGAAPREVLPKPKKNDAGGSMRGWDVPGWKAVKGVVGELEDGFVGLVNG